MKQILLIVLMAASAISVNARKQTTTRNVSKAPASIQPPRHALDTLTVTDESARLSGYDKPLRATRESMFVTSSLNDTIRGLRVQLDYYDMSGRKLHSRHVDIAADIPPSDTRNVDFKSWDTQKSFYYHLGQKPRRGSATPYKVEAHVIYVLINPR